MPSPDPDSDQFWYSFDICIKTYGMLNQRSGVGSNIYISDEDLQMSIEPTHLG